MLTYFIDGKTFVWIYIFLNICLSTKYLFINKIFEMKNISLNDIFFFNLFYRWENVRLDFFNFGWYFFLTYLIEGNTVWSVVYGWLQSHIWGGSMRGIGPLRMLDRKWPEITWPEVTWLFPLLSFSRTFSPVLFRVLFSRICFPYFPPVVVSRIFPVFFFFVLFLSTVFPSFFLGSSTQCWLVVFSTASASYNHRKLPHLLFLILGVLYDVCVL